MSIDPASQPRRTRFVPVTQMMEVPVVTEAERAAMLASLQAAEARIAAGEYVEYDSKTFKERFTARYRAARNAKAT